MFGFEFLAEVIIRRVDQLIAEGALPPTAGYYVHVSQEFRELGWVRFTMSRATGRTWAERE